MKLYSSIRASMLLGKGHRFLQSGRYREALDKALKARRFELDEQFEWLCHLIEGKSRYHLGDNENALISLRKAEAILAVKLDRDHPSASLQNILDDAVRHIEKIEQANQQSVGEN